MSGFVYFLGCGDLVKIGFSVRPATRARMLAVAAPQPLHLLAAFPGTRQHERALHRLLADIRHRGEWFFRDLRIEKMIANGLPSLELRDIKRPQPQARRAAAMRSIRENIFGVPQAELAEIAGVSQPTISRWEFGYGKDPDLNEMKRISAAAKARAIAWNNDWFFEVPVGAEHAA